MSITQETFEAFLKCKTKFHLKFGAVDLRRTCAKLCHDRGGELEQIQFLLAHASVQTTERTPETALERSFFRFLNS